MIRVNVRPIHVAVAILGIASCLFLIQAAARIGFSRLLSRYALIANSTAAAGEAVRLSPSDAEAHRTRATVLTRLGKPAEAVQSLETAIRLRPRDDSLWLELGNAREELGDTAGALAAFDQAVRWAPYYGHSHWQRGNLLLRMGRFEEAFAELRTAASADRRYFPNLIDLAWDVSGGDAKRTEEMIDIENDEQRLALIGYLARKGKGKEVIDQIRLLSTPPSIEAKREFVRQLFYAKAFREAFDLWADSTFLRVPALFNGGFEDSLVLSEAGFGGWVGSTDQNKNRLAIDVAEKSEGSRSLQITFAGDWSPGTTLLSQTVLVEPGKTYPFFFSVKAKDVVTGSPPLITVIDAENNQLLGKSAHLPSPTTSWVRLNFEFTTLATSEAVVIGLQRSNCDSPPCPIFGTLWLDEISIEPWTVTNELRSADPADTQR